MAGLLFVSQAILDTWAEQGKIDFSGNVMTVLAGEGQGRGYRLEPAVRFLKVVGAEVDPNRLLAKVKSEAQLRELGAEVLGDSVILGDAGSEVEPGFLAEVSALQAAAASKPDPARAASKPPTAAAPPARPSAPAPPAARPAVAATAPVAGKPPAGATPPPAAPPPAGTPPPAATRPPSPKDLEARRKEAEALARFLLETLS
jgi:hypothetical protein